MRKQDTINNLIPKAMEAIEKVGIAKNGIVNSTYESYIASFGANIRQSGLLPTLIFFNNDNKKGEDKGKKESSSKWLQAILYLLDGETGKSGLDLIEHVINNTKKTVKNKYNQTDLDIYELQAMQSKIEDIVCALKMAVRTFELEKSE